GEDFEPMKTVASARKLLRLGVNMLGYGEIQADSYSNSCLMDAFEKEFHLEKQRYFRDDFELLSGKDDATPFMGAVLKDKSHVYLALKEFLKKEQPF
ncbi:MAG: hypothetical protein ACM34H_09175, partial [Deltaproteobacteria bacterium]